jgi:DNA-binding response OmpR family regulator
MQKRILVAEDDKDILLILNMMLNNAGYDVEPLPDGMSIVSGKKNWPDLFILDKDMPSIDGLAICKYLKLHDETRHIPIIMISAFHYLKQKAKDAGVDEFIEKPFGVRELLNTVEKYVNQQSHSQPIVSDAVVPDNYGVRSI